MVTKPHGQIVEVKGHKMHIRQMGAGRKTIVLLPGLNEALPSVEYAPLMRDLSKNYTVCIIEYFGYGHSDPIDTKRTNENYVQEIREGLAKAGLKPPYVLMPYSCSGIYAEYYAAKYPNEIEALILLDCTTTVEEVAHAWTYTEIEIDEIISELESFTEFPEDNDEEVIEEEIAEFVRHGYTKEEVIETITMPNHAETIFAQDIALSKNIFEVLTMQIPKEIPVLVFGSGLEAINGIDAQYEHAKLRRDHMARLGEHARLVVIEGSTHGNITYHRDYRKIICKEIDEFFGYTK